MSFIFKLPQYLLQRIVLIWSFSVPPKMALYFHPAQNKLNNSAFYGNKNTS